MSSWQIWLVLLILIVIVVLLWRRYSGPRVLYIIGNGFDMHHGYPSSYGNFRDFVQNHNEELYEALEENFCDYDALWKDFEEALADLDTDAITDDASAFLQSYGADDWSDASHHDYQYEIGKRIDLITKDLRSMFNQWILTNCQPRPDAFDKKTTIDRTARFINFNYTPTLEYVYEVPKKNIFYIHGRAENIDSLLIIGHSRKPEPKVSRSHEDDDVRVTEGEQMLDDYFADTYKTTEKIIKDNKRQFRNLRSVKKLYVLGHSLSPVDLPYFREIINHIDKHTTRWIISYYSASTIDDTRQTMIDLDINPSLVEFKRIENIDSPQLRLF